MIVLLEFVAFFLFILILGYIAPAGYYYCAYHVRQFENKEQLRIQHRLPKPGGINREVKLSLISITIFALGSTLVFQFYKLGWTNIYFRFRDYPPGYFFISIFASMVLHDTFFYWTHRFMHWQPVFKYMHAGHHRSVTPTPWAIYAFQPAEAALQFVGLGVIIIFLPLHTLALVIFLWFDNMMNTAGHTGFEVVPRFISAHPWFKGFNTVTHHDAHHTNMTKNFGSFFNVWDRWMGTQLDESTPSESFPHAHTKPTRDQPSQSSDNLQRTELQRVHD